MDYDEMLDAAEAARAAHRARPCGAWGGCLQPQGHNMGKADVPDNHGPFALHACKCCDPPHFMTADELVSAVVKAVEEGTIEGASIVGTQVMRDGEYKRRGRSRSGGGSDG